MSVNVSSILSPRRTYFKHGDFYQVSGFMSCLKRDSASWNCMKENARLSLSAMFTWPVCPPKGLHPIRSCLFTPFTALRTRLSFLKCQGSYVLKCANKLEF